MPYKWMQALKQPNGQPFMQDALNRYGYLENPQNKTSGVPIGFTLAKEGGRYLGGSTLIYTNGSVPSLNKLLKPSSERVSKYKVGTAYDISNVGLAVEETRFDYTSKTTGCKNRNSGNSNCGHEYGIKLTSLQKKALIEYLKSI